MTRVISNLWFEKDARAAVDFYVSVVPNSKAGSVTSVPTDTPSGPAGSVEVIQFTLGGQHFLALQAGKMDPFNHAFSIMVECDDQGEIDRIWQAFLDNGATEEQCGWLKDRWGLSWQITPRVMNAMLSHPDRERARRATEAMMRMVKFDIAALEEAFGGRP